MSSRFALLLDRFNAVVWDADLRSVRGPRRIFIRGLRMLYVVVRDFVGGELNLRAMSLVYTTLLSVVPLLAVIFSVLKAFGVHNQIEPLLRNFLEPLGPKGDEIVGSVIGFVENLRVGLLGSVGLGLLVYTVISLLQKIESALNFVWHIESLRSFGRRFSSYLSVTLIGPVLLFTALGITASVMSTAWVQRLVSIEPVGTLTVWLGKLIPYVLVWIAFTFVYVFVPNTRVRIGAASAGGLVAGITWQTTGWAFAAFITSSARYAAVYSSFAILILLLVWLYVNWLVLLLGAKIAFYTQNQQYLTKKPVRLVLSNRLKERLALAIMYLIAENHCLSRKPWTLTSLAERLDLPAEPVHGLMTQMKEQGYVVQSGDDPPAFLPARDIDTMALRDLLASVRGAGESRFLRDDLLRAPGPVDGLVTRLREAVDRTLAETSLRDLVSERDATPEEDGNRP